MVQVSDVNIMDVEGKVDYRDTKYCVCIYSKEDKDKYLFINTESREMYDDFQIKCSRYAFLGQKDRYVNCFSVQELEKERVIEKKGNLDYEDMKRILAKIKNSDSITEAEKEILIPELENWLNDENYASKKLSTIFKYR